MVEMLNIVSLFSSQPMLAQVGGEGGVPWLTLTTFGPLLGILALMFIPRDQVEGLRNTALLTTLTVFAISLGILLNFDPSVAWEQGAFTFQMTESAEWIPTLGIEYKLGVDGFSLWLVMLTTFLMPIAVLSTYSAVSEYVKEYMICLLFLQTGMLGALVAMDVFLFYIFWEVMLIPMYLIIGIWGGEERVKAAVKFFIYTMVGSLLMLVAILYVYMQGGAESFLYSHLMAVELSYTEQFWLFTAFALAFAIKVPLFPFHTWLPLAHVQAPTAGSVILAAVMLKLGTYGLIRYAFPMFPEALLTYAPYIALLSVIGIVYGALLALVQDNVKKLVAYSSVSHLGFCVLGLVAMTPQGMAGGMYVMLAHGVATGGLFLCVGVLYERRHSKMIEDFGGVAKVMPTFAALFAIIMLGSAALPGLAGFVGEFLSILGTSKSHFLSFGEYVFFPVDSESGRLLTRPETYTELVNGIGEEAAGPELTAMLFAAVATTGVILGAAYLLWMFKRVMFGEVTDDKVAKMPKLTGRELTVLLPIVAMIIFMGVYPKFFMGYMDPAIDQYLGYMDDEVSQVMERYDAEAAQDDVERRPVYGEVVDEPLVPGSDWVPQGSLWERSVGTEPN